MNTQKSNNDNKMKKLMERIALKEQNALNSFYYKETPRPPRVQHRKMAYQGIQDRYPDPMKGPIKIAY